MEVRSLHAREGGHFIKGTWVVVVVLAVVVIISIVGMMSRTLRGIRCRTRSSISSAS